MTKTFCDRCGAEIKKEYAWLSRKIWYIQPRLHSNNTKETWKNDDKYLCPNCENSYIHWFMNPRKDI